MYQFYINVRKRLLQILSVLLVTIFYTGILNAQEIKITPGDGAANDLFGDYISISGDYAIVSAPLDDDKGNSSGSAYIFHFDGSTWVEQQKLTASDGASNDRFGISVSISDFHAIVSAPRDDDKGSNSGSAYIFHYDGSSWIEQDKLTASDGAAGDEFGNSVSISGNYAIVGVFEDSDNGQRSGSVYMFHFNDSTWVEQQKLTASDGAEGDHFGWSVAITGDYAVVGTPGDNTNNVFHGSAYIFHYDGSSWVEQQKLTASDGAGGDWFGQSVAISGDNAIVSTQNDDDNGISSGSAYIFNFNGSSWIEQDKLLASDGAEDDRFGNSVSIFGDNAIVGSFFDDDNGEDSGSAYIFQYDGSNWIEQEKLLPSDGAEDDLFGIGVSISANYAIVGATGDDDNGLASGSAYLYPLPSNIVAWSNSQGGSFSDTSNWVGGEVPDTSHGALFDESFYTSAAAGANTGGNPPITISFDQVTTTGGLNIRKSQVIFDLQFHSYAIGFLNLSSTVNLPDESHLEIINGAVGTNTFPVLIGTTGLRGELVIGTDGILEVDTDSSIVSLAVGANDCGGGECGRLVLQNGGKVYTNASGRGTTTIGGDGGEGSVFISGNGSEWTDSTLVIVGDLGGIGLLDIQNPGLFSGNRNL